MWMYDNRGRISHLVAYDVSTHIDSELYVSVLMLTAHAHGNETIVVWI